MEKPAISLSDAVGDGPLLGEDAVVGEGAGIKEAEWTGLGEAGADRIERSDAGETGEAAVGAGGGPVGRCIARTRGLVCMGTGTEVTTSIRSTSEEYVASGCYNVNREKFGANGKRVSSKITCREMMMRRDSISMQRYPQWLEAYPRKTHATEQCDSL
jgi:hypothetical protein